MKINRKIKFGITIGLFAILSGCASAKKTVPSYGPELAPPKEAQVIPPSPEPMGPAELYGPVMPERQPRPVVLVLGPGMARGFAYVGVLQVLKEAKVSIGAIYGTEMGALIAALYSTSNNINQFQWALQKLKDQVFKPRSSLFPGQSLEDALKQILSDKDLAEARIPTRIALQSSNTGIPFIVENGNLVKILKAAMTLSGQDQPVEWDQDLQVVSASASKPFMVHEAQKLGIGPVIVVNVLTNQESQIASEQLKAADLVIQPDLKGIGSKDFQLRTDISFRGKKAANEHLGEIRRLAGLPAIEEVNSSE